MKTTRFLLATISIVLAFTSMAFAQADIESVDAQQQQQQQDSLQLLQLQVQQMQLQLQQQQLQQQQAQQPPPQPLTKKEMRQQKKEARQQQQMLALSEQQRKVADLIKGGIEANKEEIKREAALLPPGEKESLYNHQSLKSAKGWSALNCFVGFGIGSYIQGDMKFGVTQSVLDGVGWITFNVGYFMMLDDLGDPDADIDAAGIAVTLTGVAVIVTSRIMGWIFPQSYQKKYNNNLKELLNVNNVAYSIDPLLVPRTDGTPAVGLAFNFRY